MEKTEQRRKIRRAALWAALIFIGILILRSAPGQALKLYLYARTHDTFTMGEVTDFAWDTAYRVSGYGSSEMLKEKYGLEFSIEESWYTETRRMLFFRNGKLVKVLEYSITEFFCVQVWDVDRWDPDTVFSVCYPWGSGKWHPVLFVNEAPPA